MYTHIEREREKNRTEKRVHSDRNRWEAIFIKIECKAFILSINSFIANGSIKRSSTILFCQIKVSPYFWATFFFSFSLSRSLTLWHCLLILNLSESSNQTKSNLKRVPNHSDANDKMAWSRLVKERLRKSLIAFFFVSVCNFFLHLLCKIIKTNGKEVIYWIKLTRFLDDI